MQQYLTRPAQGLCVPLARLRSFWASLEYARATAAEFAALNALSDIELHRMGLTRSVLKRHIHQKHSARAMLTSTGGWHERGTKNHDPQHS